MQPYEQKFTLDEFRRLRTADGTWKYFDPDLGIYEKILRWIFFLQPVRYRLDYPIHILTAYRSLQHEKSRGRSGTSQHVFRGAGALDLRVAPQSDLQAHNFLQWQLARLICEAGIGRICFYPQVKTPGAERELYSFFHIDNKFKSAEPLLYVSGPDLRWKAVSDQEAWFEAILVKRMSA